MLASDRRNGKADDTTLLWKDFRKGLFLCLGCSLFLNLLLLVSPIYMMQVYDRVLNTGHLETLIYLTLAAAVALAVMGVLEAVRIELLNRLGAWLEGRLSGRLVAAGIASNLRGRPVGAQPLRDLGQLRAFVGGQGIYPLFDLPWMPAFLAVIWMIHPYLGLAALASAGVLFGLALINEGGTREPLRRAGEAQIAAQAEVEAASRNAEVIQAMGLLPGVLRRYGLRNRDCLRCQQAAGLVAGVIQGLSRFFRVLVQIALLGLGAWLVLRHELTGGGMIAASILLGRALSPVEQAIGTWKSLLAARASHRRLSSLLEQAGNPAPAIHLPEPVGRLMLDGVGFVPPGSDRPVLRRLSFALEPGTILGVVGPSAAGKSTLCRLLVGAFPPSVGSIRLDGAEIHTWSRAACHRHLGYLPQDVELFTGTVFENIARLAPNANDHAVIAAAVLAGVHEMILRLPDGYHTEIGPGGAILSGGQRQRIGLARALFGDPRLMVLDEPSASLDQDGNRALIQTLAHLRERRVTTVVVTHHMHLLTHADCLLVLRDGGIEALGARKDIIARLMPQLSTAPADATGARPAAVASPEAARP